MITGIIPFGTDTATALIPPGVAFRLTPFQDQNPPNGVFDNVSFWSNARFLIKLTSQESNNVIFYSLGSGVRYFPNNHPHKLGNRGGWNAASEGFRKKGALPQSLPQPTIYFEVFESHDEIPQNEQLALDMGGALLTAPGRRFRTLFDGSGSSQDVPGVSGIIDCSDIYQCLQLYVDPSTIDRNEIIGLFESFPTHFSINDHAPLLGPLPLDFTGGTTPPLIGQVGLGSVTPTDGLHGGIEVSIASPPPFVVIGWSDPTSVARIQLLGR